MSLKNKDIQYLRERYQRVICDLEEIIMDQLDEMPSDVTLKVLLNLMAEEPQIRKNLLEDEALVMSALLKSEEL